MAGSDAEQGRYRRIQLLGEGGAGRVWLVEDLHRPGPRLALKELVQGENARDEALRREFAILATLRHPNLVDVHDFDISPNGVPRFALEYIDGKDLVETVAAEGPVGFFDLTVEALRALAFLHDFDVIHRDLKPGNLLVRAEPRQGCRLVVLDFGLALQGRDTPSQRPAGTLPYLAPELFEGQNASRRSDLYALGAVLHEAVHGQPPFTPDGRDLTRFLQAVREGKRSRHALPVGYVDGLRGWLEELLDPDPSGRPASASEALARLNAACGTDYTLDTPATRAARLASGPPPGRGSELERLWSDVRTAKLPHVVWLVGDAGSGKSRLLRWLASTAVRENWEVVTSATIAPQDPESALGGLRESASRGPTLLVLDEAEVADSAALELIDAVARDANQLPVQVVVAVRPAEVRHPKLRALLDDTELVPTMSRVELGPLDSDSIRAIAARATGGQQAASQRVQWLLDASDGNAQLVEQLLVEGVWEQGGRVQGTTLENSVAKRLAWLSPEGRRWLEALAVLVRDAKEPHIALIAEQDEPDAVQAADEVERSGLAVRRGDVWSPASRLVSEQVVAQLEPKRSRDLHRRAAEILERQSDGNEGRLAILWRGAGAPRDSAAWAVRAAERALESGRSTGAADWYRLALQQTARRDPGRAGLWLKQADALEDAGQYRATYRALARPLRMVDDPAERADILTRQARALTREGRFRLATRKADEAWELSVENGLARTCAMAQLARGMALHRLGRDEEAIETLEEAEASFARLGDAAERAACLQNRAIAEGNLRRFEAAKDHATQALEAVRSLGDHVSEANLLVSLAILERRAWNLEAALDYAGRAGDMAEQHGLRYQQAAALQSRGAILLDLGRYDDVIDSAAEIESIAQHLAQRHLLSVNILQLCNALIQVGRPSEAEALLVREIETPRTGVEPRYAGYFKLCLVECLSDAAIPNDKRVKELIAEVREDPTSDALVIRFAHLLELERRARDDCPDPFEPARDAFDRLVAGLAFLEPQIESRRQLAVARHALSTGQVGEAMGLARSSVASALEAGLSVLAAQGQALLSSAYDTLGKPEETEEALKNGRTHLNEAASRIGDVEMRRDFLDRKVFRALRQPSGERAQEEEDRLMATYGLIHTLNSEANPDDVLDTMLDMALDVMRAERGMVMLRGASGEYHVHAARNLEHETIKEAAEFSRNVVLQAGGGKAVLSLDTSKDERLRAFKSVSLLGIRSVVCVPLRSRGTTIGVVYLDNQHEGRMFSENDLPFLEAFADHAALALENARERRELERSNLRLRVAADSRMQFAGIVGRASAMQRVFDLVARFAEAHLPVLILGESGTGKELIARAIHALSPRRKKPYLSENCAAIQETLLESELFGHVKGAFTGAERDHIGLFEQADHGTLLLDEIGETSPGMQAKLLRVLENGELRRVGGERATTVDVRILAATNRDLNAEVKAGRFRGDLLYRLQVLLIELPPLRERQGDVPLLVEHMLEKIGKARGRPAPPIQPEVMDLLERYRWPGNVRQLENTLQRLILLAGSDPISLGVIASDPTLREVLVGEGTAADPIYSLERNEEEQIRKALEEVGGNRTKAARLLGISRATIFRKIKEYGLR